MKCYHAGQKIMVPSLIFHNQTASTNTSFLLNVPQKQEGLQVLQQAERSSHRRECSQDQG